MLPNLDKLIENSFLCIEDLVAQDILDYTNNILLNEIDTKNEDIKRLHGYRMGNLAIKSSYLHNNIWSELIHTGLIDKITSKFPKLKYVSFGGNLNLPESKKQRIHRDTREPNLIINVPLIDVNELHGPVSIISSHFKKTLKTKDIFFKNLIKTEQYVPSKKGDVILRFSNAWHRGNANNSENIRLMLSFTLRESYPWSKDSSDDRNHLIINKKEVSPVNFGPNIYPENFIGTAIETLDLNIPFFSMGLAHISNYLNGK
tara:strand:- start:51 stop:827 length:777 start_codon:yes stop_codon:yes gene_type:complete